MNKRNQPSQLNAALFAITLQTVAEDLTTIDAFEGSGNPPFGASASQIKGEARRQTFRAWERDYGRAA